MVKEVGGVRKGKKKREQAVPAVEEWEEATRDEVVEEAGEIVEEPAEEVLGMDAVQDKEEAVAEEIENSTEEEVAAEVEPATEEGEEDSSDLEADTTGEAVENQVQQVLGKDAVQGKVEDAVLKDRQCYSVEGAEKQYMAFPMLSKIEDFKSKVPINWAEAQGWLYGGP